MKKIFYIGMIGLLALSQACDTINDTDRLIEMEEVIPQKNVLLLDFTDQLCINCPEAAIIIDTLTHKYGDALIAVSIHSSRTNLPLVTTEGKEYDQHFGIDYTHPQAVIDGLGNHLKDNWGGVVLDRFNVQAKVNLELSLKYDSLTHTIAIASIITKATTTGNLKYLLWVVEDGIVDWQKIGSKSTDYNDDYVHNHVFRTSVNGIWGENFSIDEKEEKNLTHTYEIPDKGWQINNLSIVGFIYDASTSEVYEVKKAYVNQ
ncbi:MAG: Omp28 family outer membrane lipoprotein [Dysgonamonadaceae bacterium]|jgi:hypothetical protein|nr:Omp28 family outer membrane lipoprotein [Dysgonamonadaceae bacterium]